MGRRSKAMILSGILFLGVYLCGFFLSAGKPLWLDEHFSMTRSIDGISYAEILQGRLPWEGNNFPLFYIVQKFWCGLVSYDVRSLLPVRSPGGMLFYGDPFSNIYLRLISIFLMALAPAAFFYYFYRRYSWGWGCFAALLCLSSWPLWWYGLEARPYIYFFTLTTLQAIIFLEVFRKRSGEGKLWVWFGIINVLLSLTMSTSIFQTLLMGTGCLVYFRKYLSRRMIFWVFILPIAITLYYYSFGLKGSFWFAVPLYKYYFSNISWDILVVSGLFIACAGLSWLNRGEKRSAMPIALLAASLSVVYFVFMVFLKTQELPLGQGGSPFAHRYLINLVPVGILAMTIFSRALLRSFKDVRIKVCFIVFLVIVLAWRFIYTFDYTHSWIGL